MNFKLKMIVRISAVLVLLTPNLGYSYFLNCHQAAETSIGHSNLSNNKPDGFFGSIIAYFDSLTFNSLKASSTVNSNLKKTERFEIRDDLTIHRITSDKSEFKQTEPYLMLEKIDDKNITMWRYFIPQMNEQNYFISSSTVTQNEDIATSQTLYTCKIDLSLKLKESPQLEK